MTASFAAFGPAHLGALGLTAAACAALVRWPPPRAGRPLAALILLTQAADPLIAHAGGFLTLRDSLPIQLCDLASFAAVVALWTRGRRAFELTWFWGLSGTLQALLTPSLEHGFPHAEFVRYFLLHGAIVAAALYLGPGLGLRPRRGAVWRVYGWTLVYTLAVGAVDWALDANYFFLCRKPEGSILEPFGPWPYYILGGAAVGALLFWLLDLPYALTRASSDGPAPP